MRFALLAGGLVVVVIAFILLSPSDGDDSTPGTTPAVPAATTPTAPVQPQATLLTGDQITEIDVKKGDTVRIPARSDKDDEIHVHGYDLIKDLPAGKTVSLTFKADIEGIFEIELEDAGKQIGKLVVSPK